MNECLQEFNIKPNNRYFFLFFFKYVFCQNIDSLNLEFNHILVIWACKTSLHLYLILCLSFIQMLIFVVLAKKKMEIKNQLISGKHMIRKKVFSK